ncbi:hypothetical protein [Priestia koreensis]|uniref:hypothetical protein n=1 Tax=Priestia koreensis TaxID=284581 RepID=UPI0020423A84|nr:hypothetical protein [Priestia koreensis]MCM3005828.1 hypothetical protein [Priestia koreensis]
MKIFTNRETTLVSKWFDGDLDELINQKGAHIQDEMNLTSFVSEQLEEIINNELNQLSEGYISEVVGLSFQKVDYRQLINYYKNM